MDGGSVASSSRIPQHPFSSRCRYCRRYTLFRSSLHKSGEAAASRSSSAAEHPGARDRRQPRRHVGGARPWIGPCPSVKPPPTPPPPSRAAARVRHRPAPRSHRALKPAPPRPVRWCRRRCIGPRRHGGRQARAARRSQRHSTPAEPPINAPVVTAGAARAQVAAVPPGAEDVPAAASGYPDQPLKRGAGRGHRNGRGGIEGEPIPLDSPDPRYSDYFDRVRRMIKERWGYPCVKNGDTRECEYKTTALVVEFGIARTAKCLS